MTTTPIRNLVLMLEIDRQRHETLEAAEKRDDITRAEWAPASRVWSRQQEALASAIIAEPPQTFDDVLAVLIELAVLHDEITGLCEDATEREIRDLHETTGVAVKNCLLRLCTLFRPDHDLTEAQHQSTLYLTKQAEQWLPTAGAR